MASMFFFRLGISPQFIFRRGQKGENSRSFAGNLGIGAGSKPPLLDNYKGYPGDILLPNVASNVLNIIKASRVAVFVVNFRERNPLVYTFTIEHHHFISFSIFTNQLFLPFSSSLFPEMTRGVEG